MALDKISSKQLMDLLDNTRNRITALENNAATMKLNIDDRLSVIRNIQEFEVKQMKDLTNLVNNARWVEQANKIVFSRADVVEGVYTEFGSTIHPQFLKDPTDVFNFRTVNGYTFKDNVAVTINDVAKPKYKAMLMNDSITGQDICFEEFDTSSIVLSIKMNPSELLGTTAFNVLEIVPYLPGSFTIDSLRLYSLQGYYMNDTVPASTMPGVINDIGICRLLLDDTYNLYELRMEISLKFRNSNGKYPFGLKHLYFLNANMNSDSFIVFRVKQNKYIETVSEDLIVVDQTGTVNTSCTEENTKLYIEWDNGVGIDSIATTKGLTSNPIPRDIKEFYVYYPIKRSTVSFQFRNITLR